MNPSHPHVGRKTPAQGVNIAFGEKTLLWTTVCTKDRGQWLTQQTVKDSLHSIWEHDAKAWMVGDYILMPDHVHFFCSPHDLRFSIETWFAYWKDCFSKQHKKTDWKWQRSGFHHRIRSGQEYTEKWNYLMQNPVRKGLVKQAEEWPWRGTVHPFVGWV